MLDYSLFVAPEGKKVNLFHRRQWNYLGMSFQNSNLLFSPKFSHQPNRPKWFSLGFCLIWSHMWFSISLAFSIYLYYGATCFQIMIKELFWCVWFSCSCRISWIRKQFRWLASWRTKHLAHHQLMHALFWNDQFFSLK